MPKITVEINDTLDEMIDNLQESIMSQLRDYCSKNPDTCDFEECYENGVADLIHNMIDIAICPSEVDGLHYLYGDKFEAAYQDSGMEATDNHKAVALYCYLDEKATEFLDGLRAEAEEAGSMSEFFSSHDD